ncbi:MAG: LysM peptidoglycan-binding domain-containing protein [Aggregatilineales bacterium]
MRALRRIGTCLMLGPLALLLAGCFQTAGNSIVPTLAELTAAAPASDTPLPPIGLESPPTISDTPIIPPETISPVPLTPESSPSTPTSAPLGPPAPSSDTPFITAISTGGFLTPSGTLQLTPGSPSSSGTVNPLTPTSGTANALNTPTALASENPCTYVVRPNDHLLSIARQLNITLDQLLAANPQIRAHPDQLQIGDTLNVPNCATATVVVTPTVLPPGITPPPTNTPGPTTYTIVAGDTLDGIARKFNTTVDKLEQANGLNSNSILHIGQVLIIPAP